jgi:hypothetical protein
VAEDYFGLPDRPLIFTSVHGQFDG